MSIKGVIEISAPDVVKVGEVARASTDIGATHAIVLESNKPVAVLNTAELDEGSTASVAEFLRARPHRQPRPLDAHFTSSDDYPIAAHVHDDTVVLTHGGSHFLAPFRADIVQQLASGVLTAFAADTELPGPAMPLKPQKVTYACPLGHVVSRQPEANPICWCGHPLERT